MKLPIYIQCLSLIFCSFSLEAKEQKARSLSLSTAALAPNAGGQDVYALRFLNGDNEYHAYANKTLTAGGYPLLGAGYDWRFNWCNECFWQPFSQIGAGVSTAGPYAEIDWGVIFPLIPIWLPMAPPPYVPQLRIDFATHLIVTTRRAITWNYPLWVGIAIPF